MYSEHYANMFQENVN